MSQPAYDVVAIGNAIVDVIARADTEFLAREDMAPGSMRLIEAERATALYDMMGPGREVSGGAAANTLAGFAAFGGKAAFIGQVADDQLGEVYIHDLRAAGVACDVPPRAGEPPTGRCLILVTPDGQRTMNTFLGASHYLPTAAIDAEVIGRAKWLLLEGYMWDPPEPRAAMRRAIELARAAGTKIAFSTCADFCVAMHGDDFRALIDDGLIDLLFANEQEIALLGGGDAESAIAALAPKVGTLVVTLGARGAVALRGGGRVEVAAVPVAEVVDTTGAGDLFAAGFLAGTVEGRSLEASLKLGAIAAGEVITHFGARPEADLRALAGADA